MKSLILFLCMIFSVSLFAQVTGSTKPGRLVFKKNIKQEESVDKTIPQIIVLDPKIDEGGELNQKEGSITVRGKIIDETSIKAVTINGDTATLLPENLFFSNVQLERGFNSVVVKAVNISDGESEFNFYINTDMDAEGPVISITSPVVQRGIKVVRKAEVDTIKGLAIDDNGILEVTVNSQKAVLNDDGEFHARIYLQVGDNPIVVKAVDNKFNTTIDTFFITRKLDELISAGRYIAVAIGINAYEGYWPELSTARNDAEEFAEVLRDQYQFDEVYTLLDEEATRRNIIQKLEWLTENTTKDDNVLIFYAGHGQFNKALNKGYWVPVDASSNSVADYISNSDVKTFLGGIPSKHTLLITDACFAGDIFRGGKTESLQFDPNNMEKYYKEVYRKQSRLALTSGGIEEVSDEGKDDHSIFTYYLIKALKENDKKYLDAGQLFNEFRISVANNSDQTPMLQVIRDTNDEGGQFIFIRRDQ